MTDFDHDAAERIDLDMAYRVRVGSREACQHLFGEIQGLENHYDVELTTGKILETRMPNNSDKFIILVEVGPRKGRQE